ncbi:DnaJ domain-containing protein, partial [Thamnocephalis sphaerospora]
NYYETLGVAKSATDNEILYAYMQLVLPFHPDNPHQAAGREESEQRYQRLSDAYHVLSDEERRAAYDN